MDQDGRPESEELVRLRAAAAAVAALDGPAHGATAHGATGHGGTAHGEDAHQGRDDEAAADAGFDATVHADRFSELHDALVTVLADVDRG